MDTKRDDVVTAGERPAGLRAIGLVCAVAAAGALISGCGDSKSADEGTVKSSAGADASAAAVTHTPGSPTASPTGSPTGTGSPTASTGALTDDQNERKALIPKAKVTYDKALTAATGAVADGKVVSAELKAGANGGAPFWETEVAKSDGAVQTVRVDAVSGKADSPQPKGDEDADDKRKLADRLKKATVTPQQAAQTALEKKKGTISALELDETDNGTLAWSVDVVTTNDWYKTTYDIDATNRKVLREHVDQD